MNRRSLLSGGLGLTLAASAPAAALARPGRPASGFKPAWDKTIATFHQDLQTEGVKGASFCFTHAGKVLGADYYGLADVASGRKVDADTVYHWASITKTFTAIGLMQLRDRGLVSLDDPAVKYCPELRAVHDPFGAIDEITITHLLTHSAGLRGATFPWGGDKDWMPHEPKDWTTIEDFMPYTEIEFRPGSKSDYSNLGMSLVGRVIEKVSGQTYQDYITKNVLMPLGMTRSYFDTTPWFLLPHRSNNYDIHDGKVTANGLEVETGATVANGGLNATVGDFVRYTDFLLGFNDNGAYDTVLSQKTLHEMWEPRLPFEKLGEDQVSIGLGFFVVDHRLPGGRTTRYAGHGGFQMAFHTLFQVNPDTGCAFMGGGNTVNHGHSGAWANHLREAAYDRLVPLFA
jgi:CubicO group peptidase (beta-lactamase class C family)